MAKKNNVMKIVAVSIVLLFLVSGFSVMAYGSLNSNHRANENQKEVLNYSSLSNINFEVINLTNWNYITSMSSNGNLLILTGASLSGNPTFGIFYNQNYTFIDRSNLLPGYVQNLVTSCYGDGIFLIGGGTFSNPALLEYNSSGSIIDLSSSLVSNNNNFGSVNSIAFGDNIFLIGGASNAYSPISFFYPVSNQFVSLTNNIPYYFATNHNLWNGNNFIMVGAKAGWGGSPGTPPAMGLVYTDGSFEDLSNILPSYVGVMGEIAYNGYIYLITAENSSNGAQIIFSFNLTDDDFNYLTNLFPAGLNINTITNYQNNFLIGGNFNSSKPYLAEYFPSNQTILNLTYIIPSYIKNINGLFEQNNTTIIAGQTFNNNAILLLNKNNYLFKINFIENGLPSGTSWSVTLNGTTKSSTTNTITFNEPNGTYIFEVSNASGYTAAPSSGTVNINGENEEINIMYTPVPKAIALFSDNFVSDSYINTTKWFIDSTILQNITGVEKSLFNENITLVYPPNLHASFNQGLDFWANGYLNMAGITSSHAYTAPLSVNINFSVLSIQGGNGMILLTNATGNNIIGIFISYQIWVQIGNNIPEQINYPISTGIIYSLSISLAPSSFKLTIRGGSSAYSQILLYSPSGNQSNYLTLGSFVGTFPGQVYNPTSTPQMVFYNASITSNASWNLSISAFSSSGNPDSGVNVAVVNSFNNMTYEGITPNNGTIIFRGLVSGEYEIIAEQSQGSQSVLVTKYIQIGDPYDPSLHILSISLTITPPPVPPLQASIYAINSTVAMAPWENTFIAVPSGYVGNYSYQWYVNGQSVGSGSEINYTFTISGTKSINYSKVELVVTSQGTWFGNHEAPVSTEAEIEQIVFTEPIYLDLGVLSSNSYVSESFAGKDNYAVAFINGKTLELNANFIDTYLSNTIPPWLMSIIGISSPYWGLNISDSYGNQELNYVLQAGSMVQLNNITLPGTINSISNFQGFTFDVTLNPYALYGILGDVIQVVFSLIGVINGLGGISKSSISLIPPLVDAAIMTLDHTSAIDTFDLLTGSPVKIIKSIVDGIIGFLEDLIPQLPHMIYDLVKEYAPSYLDSIGNLIGSLSQTITELFPAWKIFDLGFDLGAIIGAALMGDLNTRYEILSYNIPTVFRVNDPNSSLPYVTAIGQSVEGGWAGSWIGSEYAHSSFTAAGYSFALPSNQTFELNISNPSDTESILYNISLSSSNHNETISGTLAPGSWQEYIVNTSSGSLSVSKVYRITFTESGLPSGTSWSVTLNGNTETSTANTISFIEPNGTYSFSISPISGYSASPSSGSITVNGANVNQTITFKAVTTPTNYLLYIIIVIVVIIAVLAVVMAMRRGKNKGGPKQWQVPPKQQPPQQ